MVPKESMIPRTKRTGIKSCDQITYLQRYNIVVEPLIEFEVSNDNILSISPKEHTTDPENMVYTWLDQLLVFLFVSPKEHTTDPENMVYTWFDNYIFISNYCPS